MVRDGLGRWACEQEKEIKINKYRAFGQSYTIVLGLLVNLGLGPN